MAIDILKPIMLKDDEIEIVVNLYFTGGPILVTVCDALGTKSYSFTADPSFRRKDNYVASGALLLRFPSPLEVGKHTFLNIQFTNMFAKADKTDPVHYRLQVSSISTATVLYSDEQDLTTFGFQNYALDFSRK